MTALGQKLPISATPNFVRLPMESSHGRAYLAASASDPKPT